jgi:hypothetical protein
LHVCWGYPSLGRTWGVPVRRAFESMRELAPEERQALRKATDDQVLRLVLRSPGRVLVRDPHLVMLAATGPCR